MSIELTEFSSTITIRFGCNNLWAKDEADYRQQIKAQYYEEYGLDIDDTEIEIDKESL